MPLVLVRVDCRLIHGQVIETWLPHMGADCLIVANDGMSGNPFLRQVMELAIPPGIHAIFCAVREVPAAFAEVERLGEKAILLCASAEDALRIFRGGVRFSELNIGNLHYAQGKVEITPSVFFDREDFEAVRSLERLGVHVTVRATPFEMETVPDADRRAP